VSLGKADDAAARAIDALAEATIRRVRPESMAWDWGEGLVLYALARYGAAGRFMPFIERYFVAHAQRGFPPIDRSDRCAPALAALEAMRTDAAASSDVYRDVCERVLRYLHSARRTDSGGLNHFGTSVYARFYPQSMWVDSLMMYAVFAARWGSFASDSTMMDFAADQALAFARVLQDPKTGLWKHAWLTPFRRVVPGVDAYWLRGNGWAIAAVASILEVLPADHPRRDALVNVFARTAAGLLAHQRMSGLWSTVLNRKTYLETSGSALCAYGLLVGGRTAPLPEEARAAAIAAVSAIGRGLAPRADGPSLPAVSASTMPYPAPVYAWIPRRHDLAHGLAAVLLAARALEPTPR
jgi:unsaturated rhamnogalacturonyl hydrolase